MKHPTYNKHQMAIVLADKETMDALKTLYLREKRGEIPVGTYAVCRHPIIQDCLTQHNKRQERLALDRQLKEEKERREWNKGLNVGLKIANVV